MFYSVENGWVQKLSLIHLQASPSSGTFSALGSTLDKEIVVLQRSFNPVWPLWSLSNKLTSTQPEPPLQFKHLHILARMRHRWKILKGMGKKSIIPIPLKVQTASGYPAIDLLLLHSIACGTVLQHSLLGCYISSQCSVFSLCWTTRNACKIGKRIASVVQH